MGLDKPSPPGNREEKRVNRQEAISFIEDNKNGVLGTLMKDGRPHAAPIVYAVSGGAIEISSCGTRVTTKNL